MGPFNNPLEAIERDLATLENQTVGDLLWEEIRLVNSYYGKKFQGPVVLRPSGAFKNDLAVPVLEAKPLSHIVLAESNTHNYLFVIHDDWDIVCKHGRVLYDIEAHLRGGWVENIQSESLFPHRAAISESFIHENSYNQ